MAINNYVVQIFLFWILTVVILFGGCAVSQEYNCSEVTCLSKTYCPSDSYVRDVPEFDQILVSSEEKYLIELNLTNLVVNNESIFKTCCVREKCECKICHRPSCANTTSVLMEIIKESDIPGKCCGEYECTREPNCTEVQNTRGLGWLIDCQRCECLAGQKICHRSCDEIRLPPANCIGRNSEIFSNGQIWKEDECTHCECSNGEKKCQTSFCKPLNCLYRIRLSGECCAVCKPPIQSAIESTSTSSVTSMQSLPSSVSVAPLCKNTTNESPSPDIRTEYAGVIQTSNEICILYGVIACLCIILIIFITLYCHEKLKQRSYRPVTSLDDNYNKVKLKNSNFL